MPNVSSQPFPPDATPQDPLNVGMTNCPRQWGRRSFGPRAADGPHHLYGSIDFGKTVGKSNVEGGVG